MSVLNFQSRHFAIPLNTQGGIFQCITHHNLCGTQLGLFRMERKAGAA